MLIFEKIKIRRGKVIMFCHQEGSRLLIKKIFSWSDVNLFSQDSQNKIKDAIKQISCKALI